MFASLNKPGALSLVLNVLLAVGAALVMNGLIFGLGWNRSTDYATKPSFEPPGYVVGLVWEGLFALMATARWLLNSRSGTGASRARALVTLLIIFCLLWAFYSLAIGSLIGGLLGNLGTIAIASFTVARLGAISKTAAFLIMPVVLWVTFATAIVLSELGWL